MNDKIISADEIYLQEIVYSMVAENLKEDDFAIYNRIVTIIDVPTLERTGKILKLIKLNKRILKTDLP